MRVENMAAPVTRSLTLPADGAKLSGDLTLPANARGLVLFAHGSGSSRHSPRNQFVASELVESGLGTFLFDLLTPREEAEDLRTAELRFDIGFLADRLKLATEWIQQQPDLSDLPLGYFGASTGGAAALVAAARVGSKIRAVVSRGGRPDLAGGAALRAVASPTLLIVGSADTQVLALNRQAFQLLNCEKELAIVPGATHLFEEPGTLERVAERAAAWFNQWLPQVP